jgi:hypothetical protein
MADSDVAARQAPACFRAAHRCFCASDICLRAAADLLREPGKADRRMLRLALGRALRPVDVSAVVGALVA